MHLFKGAWGLMTFVLVGSLYMARAAPRVDSRALDFRALGVRDGVKPPLPEPKDDDLPQRDDKDLIPWSDDDYAGEDYKSFPDYDENQDRTSTMEKRVIGPLGVSLPHTKGYPMNPNQGGTRWLRNVGIDGKWRILSYSRSLHSLSAKTNLTLILRVEIGQGFRASSSQQKFVGLTGTREKTISSV